MTPEERAAVIDWPEDTISMSWEESCAIVAAAIRAAENDALERAALVLEQIGPANWDTHEFAADLVRALKHKETT